jgi:hypothetical protein
MTQKLFLLVFPIAFSFLSPPILQEYGPLDVQELRESYMVDRIRVFMEPYKIGLFIVGLAHLHSILSKLKTVGFDVRGYSWIDQK